MFTRQVNVQIGKTLFEIQTLICGYRLWREQNNFPSNSCVIRRVLFIFPQEVDGAEPSEMDIEMLIWAPLCLNTINGKSKNSTIDIPYLEKVIVSSEGIELEETESYFENKCSCFFFMAEIVNAHFIISSWEDRLRKATTLGRCSFWERSSFVSWFSLIVFRDVSRMVPRWTRAGGFRGNCFYLDRAPKKWFFVLMNTRDSFLVTLPSVSPDTWTI